jgi:hypothetical protein
MITMHLYRQLMIPAASSWARTFDTTVRDTQDTAASSSCEMMTLLRLSVTPRLDPESV